MPHIIFVILKHATNDMQKIFLIQTTEKKYAFWCHAVTSGTNLRRLPQLKLSQFAYNETKENLNKVNADHADKEQELQAQFAACKEELAAAKEKIAILEDEVMKANLDCGEASEKSEEHDILKEMIVEKDETIKKNWRTP